MPQYPKDRSIVERLALLEEEVAQMRRSGRRPCELPVWATGVQNLAYSDATSHTTVWQTQLTPRHATLRLGLVLVGDTVSGVTTGGDWQVRLAGTVVASGTVAASGALHQPDTLIDLTPYLLAESVLLEVQTRRQFGATTGGRFGGGGSIGSSIRYARLI